jgi:hypothetical protein
MFFFSLFSVNRKFSLNAKKRDNGTGFSPVNLHIPT